MDAACGQGLQAVLHVAGDQGIAAPLRRSADAHWAAEEDNAPKANGKGAPEKWEVAALGRESDAESGRAVRGLAGASCKDPRVGSSPLGLRFRKVPKPGMYPEGFSPYVMRLRQVPTTKYLSPPSPPRPRHRPPSCFARRDSEVARGLNLTIADCVPFAQTSSLKNEKKVVRLSRPEILQDLDALRCLSGTSCPPSPSNPDTLCVALDSDPPLNPLSPLLAPVASCRAGAQRSSTDFSCTMYSLAMSSLGRSPVSCAAASSASTVDSIKDSESSRLQGAREGGGWGAALGTGRGGRAIRTPKRFLDHVSVQASRKRVQIA
jgi:hypothetical protein